MPEGYIKLHRKILKNPVVCKDADYFSIWCYLLLSAAHSGATAMFRGKRIELRPGQLITGRHSISLLFSVTPSKVQRILKCYENEHQIEQLTSNRNRLITILNWDEYQSSEQQNDEVMNTQRTTDVMTLNTNKNVKNDKKYIDSSKEESCPGIIPDASSPAKKKWSKPVFEHESKEYKLALKLEEMIHNNNPDAKKQTEAGLQSWAYSFDLMHRSDKRGFHEIYDVMFWAENSDFWKTNILSAGKLREQYDRLKLQMEDGR